MTCEFLPWPEALWFWLGFPLFAVAVMAAMFVLAVLVLAPVEFWKWRRDARFALIALGMGNGEVNPDGKSIHWIGSEP